MYAFQQFQQEFGRHLRDPRRARRPDGVPARRMAIYGELLYDNLEGFLLACFPVTRRLLGERRWQSLVRAFFREARCRTPWFREIPREFLDWLGTVERPPTAWLAELAHYEWVELALDVMDAEAPPHDPFGDLMTGRPLPAPASMNLDYAWPVHRIGPDFRPRKPQETHLLVFRDAQDEIRFIELNRVTSRLVALLGNGRLCGRAACAQVANEIGRADKDAVAAHGEAVLEELRAQGAIWGTRS